MNLTASSTKSSRRPYQAGRALGQNSGSPTSTTVDWLIDTGADYATVWRRVGNRFDVAKVSR